MSGTQTGKLIPYVTEMFRLQAWVAMGKIANPASGKVERELMVARAMIDLLAELQTRTEGNRSDEETKILQGAITELRLNYVEEAKKPEQPEPEAPADEAGKDADAAGDDPEGSSSAGETPSGSETT